MLTDRSLGALRAAATLTHCLPGLRARIRVADQLRVEVGRASPAGPIDGSVMALTPCAFRNAVGQAMQHQREGRRMSILGLPDGWEPEIELTAPDPYGARAGGMFGVAIDGVQIWAFATSLVPGLAHDLGRPIVDEVGDLVDLSTLGIRPDPVTEISLAFARTTAAAGSAEEDEILELLHRLMARWTMHELLVAAGAQRDGARPV